MNLPNPGPSYNAGNEAQTRAAIEAEDTRNLKKGGDIVIKNNRLILTSPDGTQWSGTITDAGVVSWAAL
jgi:hypothetical protein